jgi:hypothetical protein
MPLRRDAVDPFEGIEEILFPRYRAGGADLARALREGKRADAIEAFQPQRVYGRRLPRLALPGSVPREQETSATAEETASELTWIQIRLLDEIGDPMSGAAYKIKLPNGAEISGTLDAAGEARHDGIEPGRCEVSFPDLDQRPLPALPAA